MGSNPAIFPRTAHQGSIHWLYSCGQDHGLAAHYFVECLMVFIKFFV